MWVPMCSAPNTDSTEYWNGERAPVPSGVWVKDIAKRTNSGLCGMREFEFEPEIVNLA